MSEAKWCDRGDHAFSVNTDDWEHYNGTKMTKNPTTGRIEPVVVAKDVCGPCSKSGDLATAAAITSVATETTD